MVWFDLIILPGIYSLGLILIVDYVCCSRARIGCLSFVILIAKHLSALNFICQVHM